MVKFLRQWVKLVGWTRWCREKKVHDDLVEVRRFLETECDNEVLQTQDADLTHIISCAEE
jgi:hypothetical protein